ncbi:hypothetical protein AU468_14020 [Alkalispirochaeta sphaeroplastigenens]|uniref:DUF4595 domain-containing protein n=1 Tax=Alkalispirochaeta sphaeroplastigenens TaxID=1187066 RepID=A0A2S4JFI5_9SPIO|nr:hypothetical protein [Alkalispirochaeta sphaeroplastigenens]POQ98327.1 hypothetical protein AU468_14020 [Alkalispirochaeta sphaeroplastigenens]
MKKAFACLTVFTGLIAIFLLAGCDLMEDDDNDKAPRVIVQSFNGDGDPTDRKIFSFDKAGQITGWRNYNNDTLNSWITYDYNDEGKIVGKTSFIGSDPEDPLASFAYRFRYPTNRIIIKERIDDDSITEVARVTFDSTALETFIYNNSSSDRVIDWIYDSNSGRWSRTNLRSSADFNDNIQFIYDEDELKYSWRRFARDRYYAQRFTNRRGRVSSIETRTLPFAERTTADFTGNDNFFEQCIHRLKPDTLSGGKRTVIPE